MAKKYNSVTKKSILLKFLFYPYSEGTGGQEASNWRRGGGGVWHWEDCLLGRKNPRNVALLLPARWVGPLPLSWLRNTLGLFSLFTATSYSIKYIISWWVMRRLLSLLFSLLFFPLQTFSKQSAGWFIGYNEPPTSSSYRQWRSVYWAFTFCCLYLHQKQSSRTSVFWFVFRWERS